MAERTIAGIDLGGTKAAVILGKSLEDGAVRVEHREAFAAGLMAEPEAVLDRCLELLTGQGGGKLWEIADSCIRIPERETYLVQELHLPVYHALCAQLEEEFFGER